MIVVNVTCNNLHIDTTYMTDCAEKHIPKCNFILFGKVRLGLTWLCIMLWFDVWWDLSVSLSVSAEFKWIYFICSLVNSWQIVTVKFFLVFNVRFLLQRIIQEPDDGLKSQKAFGQLELCASERNCEYLPILFPISSLSNIMMCKHPREETTDMAANINNSSIHLLAKYESPIVRQLDMLLKWRVKSQKLFLMAQWLLFIGG